MKNIFKNLFYVVLIMFISCTQSEIGSNNSRNQNTNPIVSEVNISISNYNDFPDTIFYSFKSTRDSNPVIIPEITVPQFKIYVGTGELTLEIFAHKDKDTVIAYSKSKFKITSEIHQFSVKILPSDFNKPEIPTINPVEGTYSVKDNINVTLSHSDNNATIYYTLDGSTPTTSSTQYNQPFQMNNIGIYTVKSIAVVGDKASTVLVSTYTIVDQDVVKPVIFSPEGGTYTTTTFQGLTLKSDTSGAFIYYTTDNSEPTQSSKLYSNVIQLEIGETTVKAKAFKSGFTPSSTSIHQYTIINGELPKALPPVITPSTNIPYNISTKFTISTPTPDSTILYSIDNEVVDNLYSTPLNFPQGSHIIRAKTVKNGYTPSDVIVFSCFINGANDKVSTPIITIEGTAPYKADSTKISITSTTSGATIYYTTNGSNPTKSSTLYSNSFTMPEGTYTISAIAVKDTLVDSDVSSATYTFEFYYDGIIIHFEKPDGWTEAWLWFDKDSDGNWETNKLKTPPSDMENYRAGWYRKKFPSTSSVTFLFNDGTWDKKLADINGKDFVTTKTVWIEKNGKINYNDPVTPPQPKKPEITISPSGGKVRGSDNIIININTDSDLKAKSATFNNKSITINGTSATIKVQDFLNNNTSGTMNISAENNTGVTNISAIFNRDDTVIISEDDIDNLRIFQIMVCSFQDGDPSIGYTWQHNSGQMAGGDLQGIINSLDYIKGLGMNAIWMTPIFETYGGDQAHNGYFANNYFKVDPKFGTNDLFKILVQKAHEKGLYVILDGVLGHNAGSNIAPSPLSGKKPDTNNPVNYSNPDSLQFYKDVVYYWIKEFKIDGWRFDQSYQLGPGNSGHAGQGQGKFFWNYIRKEVERAVQDNKNDINNPTVNGKKWGILGYMVGEDWQGEDDIAINTYGTNPADPGIHSAFDFPGRYRLVQSLAREEHGKEVTTQRSQNLASTFDTHKKYPEWAHPNLFLGNHDLARFGDLVDYSSVNKNYYYQRHKAAFSFLATYSKPITLFYGEEWGQKTGSNQLTVMHISRTTGKISNFNEQEQDLINFLKKLMQLRADNSSLWQEKTRTNLIADGDKYADLKYDSNTGNKTVYCLNTGTNSITIELPAADVGGTYLLDGISGGKLYPSGGKYTVNLNALEPKIFIVTE